MALYPKVHAHDPRWGEQRPGRVVVDGRVRRLARSGEGGVEQEFVPLDDEESAGARALTALEAGASRHEALARGLNGADEVATVSRLLDEIEAEVCGCRAVSPADHTTVTKFKAALPTVWLDATKWYNGLKAEKDVATYAELRDACAVVVEV